MNNDEIKYKYGSQLAKLGLEKAINSMLKEARTDERQKVLDEKWDNVFSDAQKSAIIKQTAETIFDKLDVFIESMEIYDKNGVRQSMPTLNLVKYLTYQKKFVKTEEIK